MVNAIKTLSQENYQIKQQLGELPDVITSVKRFTTSIKPIHHSVQMYNLGYNETNEVMILGHPDFGTWGSRNWGTKSQAFDTTLYAIKPSNNTFVEYFHENQYIDTSVSTGTLNADETYSLTSGQILQSGVIAKLREPITKALLYSNDDFIDDGGMVLPFKLGVDTFGGNNVNVYFSNDSGNTWINADEGVVSTFETSSNNDEFKYKIVANNTITISKPISIKIN